MNRPKLYQIAGREEREISRRRLLLQITAASFGLPLAAAQAPLLLAQSSTQSEPHTRPAAAPTPSELSPQDDRFLEDLEHANFLFFWEQSNPPTGLTKDRCNVRINDRSMAASIASTGFGLTAICIGEKRGFVSYSDARLRVIQALSFLWHKLPTAASSFTSQISTPAKECGTQRFRPWTPPFCSAAS
jgi:hypothetical protein